MKYKLLKDLPYAKAGEVFERVTHKSEDGLSDYDYLEIRKREADGEDETRFSIDYNNFLDNFDEWFEKIEPTNSINWKPKVGEGYWSRYSDGEIGHFVWSKEPWHGSMYKLGRVYRTKEECEKAHERELAEVRLRRTSDFEPDFKNERSGWVVCYDYRYNKLGLIEPLTQDFGEIVHYATKEDAEKSIIENREDWMIYFGVKE